MVLCEAVTVSINAHGAYLKLLTDAEPHGRIVLENIANHEAQEVRIVSVEPVSNETGAFMTSVEFSKPAPEFWGRVYFYSTQGLEVMYVNEQLLNDPVRGCAAARPR